ICEAFLELAQALGCASTLGKQQYRDLPFGHDSRSLGHALEGSARARSIDWYVSGALQMSAQKWHFGQTFFRKEAKLVRQRCEDRRYVHIARVVGDKHVRLGRIELFKSFHAYPHEAHGEQRTAPKPGDVMGSETCRIEPRDDPRERAQDDC